jgi:hypothetical protein
LIEFCFELFDVLHRLCVTDNRVDEFFGEITVNCEQVVNDLAFFLSNLFNLGVSESHVNEHPVSCLMDCESVDCLFMNITLSVHENSLRNSICSFLVVFHLQHQALNLVVSNETFYHVINFIMNESPLAIDQFDLLFLGIQSVELAIILGVIGFNELFEELIAIEVLLILFDDCFDTLWDVILNQLVE